MGARLPAAWVRVAWGSTFGARIAPDSPSADGRGFFTNPLIGRFPSEGVCEGRGARCPAKGTAISGLHSRYCSREGLRRCCMWPRPCPPAEAFGLFEFREFREALKKRVQGRACQQLPLDGPYAFDDVTQNPP